jgi:hypothetical protein
VEDKLAALTVESPESPEDTETEDPFKDVPVLSRTTAELYLFDTETDVFVIQEKEVDVDMASNGDFDSMSSIIYRTDGAAWIIIRHKGTPFISVPIDEDLNPRFDMVSPLQTYEGFRSRSGKRSIHVHFPGKRRSTRHDLVFTFRPRRLLWMERQLYDLHVGGQEQDLVRQGQSRRTTIHPRRLRG